MKDFNLILKQERELAGLCKVEAARLLEVPYRTFKDWERGATEPPHYTQKAILYCIDAIRSDLLAGELNAELVGGLIDPRELLQVERDSLGRIVDWSYSERKMSELRHVVDWEDGEELHELPPERTEHMTLADALRELATRNPYLTDEEAESLYPDD